MDVAPTPGAEIEAELCCADLKLTVVEAVISRLEDKSPLATEPASVGAFGPFETEFPLKTGILVRPAEVLPIFSD